MYSPLNNNFILTFLKLFEAYILEHFIPISKTFHKFQKKVFKWSSEGFGEMPQQLKVLKNRS